ncbi:MAG: chemotaxis protein [Nitrospirae bacterium]|nr:chemotaxis protein [Nitrospirota bacterium]
MSKWMAEIDQRTRLAGANKMELLMFGLGTEEIYGINVFKIREVMKLPPITKIPDSDPRVLGLVNLRGENIPLVNLRKAIGIPGDEEESHKKLIITEYNDNKQGFLVAEVDRIIRLSWERIHTPPPMVRSSTRGAVTAVTKLDDGRMVLILDVEKILAELHPRSDEEMYKNVSEVPKLVGKRVLLADDSLVARKQITKTLERLGVTYDECVTGKEALEFLKVLADEADRVGKPLSDRLQLILTDIEMPEMDGFTLTKNIRSDPRMSSLPILMHSSLSGNCNVEKGKSVGVTDYVTKFDPNVLQEALVKYL